MNSYKQFYICINQKTATWKAAFVFVICYFLLYLFLRCDFDTPRQSQYSISKGNQVHLVDAVFSINKTSVKKILLWTNFFGTMGWEFRVRHGLKNCSCNCHVTGNKKEIDSADAVIFHLLDLRMWIKLPNTRVPHQVWVLYNMESPIFLSDIGINLSSWKFLFNWTMSYRKDSTVYSPYGYYTALSEKEKRIREEAMKSRDLYREKYKMVFAMVGDCYDDSGRLNLLHELQHHVSLDFYGRCGNLSCSEKFPKLCYEKLKPYKFRAAFENGNCRDYVTEKFWDPLERGAIPIVNWKRKQIIENVPPRSYINVYDFENVAQLGSFLKKVSENKTLFDSYHVWRTNFRTHSNAWDGFCNLCEKLHETKRQAQTIIDPLAWIKDDTCNMWSIKNVIRRHFNTWAFNLGWRYGIHGNRI